MNSEVYLLSDQIEDVKTKLTDSEYKNMVDTLKRIHDRNNDIGGPVIDRPIMGDDYYTIPKQHTEAWYRLSLEQQIIYSGNKYYEEWIWDHLTEQDIRWYKSHLDEVPEHLKEHPSIYSDENCCKNCTIQ